MRRITVGLVDYGLGNHASVTHALHDAGFRVRTASDPDTLDACDILLLPGVGAFPSAMERLERCALVDYLKTAAASGRALLGICLGMQLLAEESYEHGYTKGLGLIPGRVEPLVHPPWHIGWNSLECVTDDPAFAPSHGKSFYFNHSFALAGADAHRTCVARLPHAVTAAVRAGRVAGLQFHPEKSQGAGMQLLHNLVTELVHA